MIATEPTYYPTLAQTLTMLDCDGPTLRKFLRETVVMSATGLSIVENSAMAELPDRKRLAPASILYAAYRLRKPIILELAATLVHYAVDANATSEELDIVEDQVDGWLTQWDNIYKRVQL